MTMPAITFDPDEVGPNFDAVLLQNLGPSEQEDVRLQQVKRLKVSTNLNGAADLKPFQNLEVVSAFGCRFTRDSFQSLRSIREVRLSQIKGEKIDFSGLHLETVSLDYSPAVSEYWKAARISKLDITGATQEAVDRIPDVHGLRVLMLFFGRYRSLDPLKSIADLEWLRIVRPRDEQWLDSIKHMSLKKLMLQDVDVVDVSRVCDIRGLQSIYITAKGLTGNASCIFAMSELRRVHLTGKKSELTLSAEQEQEVRRFDSFLCRLAGNLVFKHPA